MPDVTNVQVQVLTSAPGLSPLEVEALDRSGLLRDIAAVLSEYHVSIVASGSQTSADRVARLRFDFELADPGHLESIIGAVKRVRSVYEARRVLPGAAGRERVLTFADCGVLPDPTPAQLAELACLAADHHRALTQEEIGRASCRERV